MNRDIPGFWKDGPHEPVHVENTWRDFVRSVGGHVVEDLLPNPRTINNADFAFLKESVIAELKEIETEFSSTESFKEKFDALMKRLISENENWKPKLFGGDEDYPSWFHTEFIRIFRPPLTRILKKANSQIKETKKHFGINTPSGVILLVNDGFTSISPFIVRNLIGDILTHSYSSIDCYVYLTVNRYIEIDGSDEPQLIWAPMYSSRSSDELVAFINVLGKQWFDFLECSIGPFSSRTETESDNILKNSKSITHPELPLRKRKK